MSGNSPRAAVGSFPYPHRTVAQVDAAEGRIFAAPAPRPVRPPKWARVKGSVRIVATIATISMGVTLGKVWM